MSGWCTIKIADAHIIPMTSRMLRTSGVEKSSEKLATHTTTHPHVPCTTVQSRITIARAQLTAPKPPTHPPNHPPCTGSAPVREYVNAGVVAASFRGRVCQRFPHVVELGVRKYGTSAATVLRQKQHAQHAIDRPIYPTTHKLPQRSKTYGGST